MGQSQAKLRPENEKKYQDFANRIIECFQDNRTDAEKQKVADKMEETGLASLKNMRLMFGTEENLNNNFTKSDLSVSILLKAVQKAAKNEGLKKDQRKKLTNFFNRIVEKQDPPSHTSPQDSSTAVIGQNTPRNLP